jgi:predicted esterase YcpF (UPF0227 family)
MRTLYIHGLDSYPVPEKTEIMKDAGLKVVALHLNYREKLGIYETLKDTAVRKKVEFIVGSSLGGYLGYWLAEDLGLPCLLFNPAMHYDDVFYSKMPEIENLKCPVRYVVLGARDKTQKLNEVTRLLKSEAREDLNQRILTCEWLGHEIDLNTFQEMVNWAVHSIKLHTKASK